MNKLLSVILLIFVVANFINCTDPQGATRILSMNGYTNIEIISGYQWFACSEDDIFATGFRAKSPTGQIVEGCVCGGIIEKFNHSV